jgi:hypothetical protein
MAVKRIHPVPEYVSRKTENAIIVKAHFKNGYSVTRRLQLRKHANKIIDQRIADVRVVYIDIIPPQNYRPASMEKEADKCGYSIEKYQKVFGI